MKKLITAALLFSLVACQARLQDSCNVIPQPRQTEILQGKGVGAEKAAQDLVCELTQDGTPESGQGYVLEITEEKTVIKSKSDTGIFYARKTLNQIVADARESGKKIQPMRIVDWPDMDYRGIHIGYWFQIENKEYLYRLIDKLSEYKINGFFFETEDKLKYESHPELATSLALTKDEMKALCEYAHERYVEIDPLVQGLAHAFYILKHHPEIRECDDDLFDCCPSSPETYELLFDLYDEAIEAMPYCRYVHIGGDEVEKIGICPRCKATGKTPFELNMEWMWKVAEHIKAKGRIPVIWDDMPLRHSGMVDVVYGNETAEEVARKWNPDLLQKSINLFPKGCEYVRWNYEETDTPGTRAVLDWYHANNLPVMAATAADNGAQKYMPRPNSRLAFIREFSNLAKEYGMHGVFSTYWQDKGAITEFAMRGFIGQGEFGWNAGGRSVDEFMQAHAVREFGFEPADSMMNFLPKLEQAVAFLDTAVVYVHGKKKTVIELPDSRYPGKWSEKHKNRLETAGYWDNLYPEMEAGIERAIKKARRNHYTLRMYRENNRHQHYDVELLLSLQEYDLARNREEREKALEHIEKVCDKFEPMCRQLESVFGESCQLDMPEDYILIKWGVLPSLSKDFSWNYHYEIPMVQNVRKWLEEQRDAPFRMVIRSWSYSALHEDLLKREIAQYKKYPVFDEIWMFLSDTVNDSGVQRYVDAVRGAGIDPCFEQQTLGHNDPSERPVNSFLYGEYNSADQANPTTSRFMVGPDGTATRTQACPRDDAFIAYAAAFNAHYAKMMQPKRVMIDDDLRLYNHKPIDAACFCNHCIERFNKEYGYEFNRTTLVQALESSKSEKVRRDWVEFGQASLGHVAAEIGRAIKSVSPKTDLGLENGCNTMVPVTGVHLTPVFDSIYAATGVPPSYRPGAGFYRDYEPRGMITKADDLARQIRLLPEYVKSVPAEIEGWRHTATGKSPHSIAVESLLYLSMGCTQLSYAICSSMSEPIEWYADSYFKVLEPLKKQFEEYAEFNRGTEPGGLDEFISTDWYVRTDNFFKRESPDIYIARYQAIGLPFTPGGHYACAYMMTGRELKVCNPNDLENILRKGIILDEAAFEIFDKDGLVPTNDLNGTSLVKTFQTKQGGRLAVIPSFKPTNINIARRDELIKIADWVSYGKLPVVARTFAQMMYVPRVESDGKLRSVLALNCTISDYENIDLELRGCSGARKMTWKVPGNADKKLRFVLEEDKATVTIPSLDDWCAGWIAVEY